MEHMTRETGRNTRRTEMTRRRLIQSLAVASAAAARKPTQAADRKEFHAIGVNHISYVAPDYAKTRDFYVDLFGMTVSLDDGGQAYCWFGDTLFIPRNARSGEIAPSVDHIGYTIAKYDKSAVETELKSRGLTPRADTDLSWHVKDLEGYDLQVCAKDLVTKPDNNVFEEAKLHHKAFHASSVNHIGYVAADYAKVRDFYKDMFGLRVTLDDGSNAYCWFGDSVFIPRKANAGEKTPYVDHIAFTIDNYEKNAVEAELRRRGLQPRLDTDLSFNCVDLNGYQIQVCDKDLVTMAEKQPPEPPRQ